MHERSLATSLVRAAEEAARSEGARCVLAVRARLPELGHVSPEHLRAHFEIAAAGTIVEGARLDVAPGAGEGLVLESIEVRDEGGS
jgi:hydrogenase nickel incorporation protein HypA/HybF